MKFLTAFATLALMLIGVIAVPAPYREAFIQSMKEYAKPILAAAVFVIFAGILAYHFN
jgi:hypothetical protein